MTCQNSFAILLADTVSRIEAKEGSSCMEFKGL